MSKTKYIRVIEKGSEAWNTCREKNLDPEPDLSGAKLTLADLTNANLIGANLCAADLSKANLRAADLSGSDLSLANLTRADA